MQGMINSACVAHAFEAGNGRFLWHEAGKMSLRINVICVPAFAALYFLNE